MSQGIPQMIEIATEKRWKEDFENKHKKKAGNGWFRYSTRFALPVMWKPAVSGMEEAHICAKSK